jgi:hypothetical protein
MSYAITYSRAYVGVDAPLVSVQTHLSSGLPALTIVGINRPIFFTKPQANENHEYVGIRFKVVGFVGSSVNNT